MAKYSYDIKIRVGFSYIALDNFTSFSVNIGRQQVQDPFKSNTAIITGIRPADLPTIDIGSEIFIECPSVYVGSPISAPLVIFSGVVADLSINYGNTPNMDTWEISCEDSLAQAGRSYVTGSWSAGIQPYTAAVSTASLGGLFLYSVGAAINSNSLISAQSFTNANLLDLLNTLVATEQGRIYGTRIGEIAWLQRLQVGTGSLYTDFSDGTLATSNPVSKYNNIVFRSLADSYFTKTIVEPSGLASQSSGTGTRVFTMNSYDQTTAQAAELAAYVQSTLKGSRDAPSVLSCTAETQSNNEMIKAAVDEEGALVGVILRGVKYNCFIEGSTITADANQTLVRLYLTSSNTLSPFKLDSSILGVLDQNKLGF